MRPGAGGYRRIATYHPSAVLRARRERRSEIVGALVGDLGAAVRAAA